MKIVSSKSPDGRLGLQCDAEMAEQKHEELLWLARLLINLSQSIQSFGIIELAAAAVGRGIIGDLEEGVSSRQSEAHGLNGGCNFALPLALILLNWICILNLLVLPQPASTSTG